MSNIVKQVIIVRGDLKCRTGKWVAQGSHASISFLIDRIKCKNNTISFEQDFSTEEQEWMTGNFTKVCLKVTSEQELFDVYNKAKEAGLTVHLIIDNGTTEFHGVKTLTALAIGPHVQSKFEGITSHLPLY